jgi:hypothetical protein
MMQLAISLFLIVIAFYFTNTHAQEKAWSLDVSGNIGLSYRALIDNDKAPSNASIITLRDEQEMPSFCGGTSLNGSYQWNPFFQLSLGVEYFNLSWKTKKMALYFENPDPFLPQHIRIIDAFDYIGLPLQIKAILPMKLWQFQGVFLYEEAILISSRSTNIQYYSDHKEQSTSPSMYAYKKQNSFLGLKLVAKRKISPKMAAQLDFGIRVGTRKIIDAPISAQVYSTGLGVGISYTL